MKRLLATAGVFSILTVLFCGCGGSAGSESTQISRARLVGNENLNLKKQIADKDIQIKDLEKKFAAMENEKAKLSAETADTHFKLLQIIAESEKRKKALTAENQTFKEELEKLKK